MPSWLRRRGREIRALAHYRPQQIGARAAILLKRRGVSLFPAPLRRRIGQLRDAPPPTRDIRCADSFLAFALESPLTPPEAAEGLLSGHLTFLGESRPYEGGALWRLRGPSAPSHLWRMNLHYHRFLVEAAVGALRRPRSAEAYLTRAVDLLEDWTHACVPGEASAWTDSWNSYSVSTRILNAWIARHLLERVAAGVARGLALRLNALAASHAGFLSRWIEWDLGGNHLLRNGAALAAAGAWFGGPSGDAWRRSGEAILCRAVTDQILSDGFHDERSPMYQSLVLEDLLVGALLSRPPAFVLPPPIEEGASRLANALPRVVHPDGQIALFNDSAFGVAPPPERLLTFGRELGVGSSPPVRLDLPAAGYYRFESEGEVLLFDAGPLGPDHLPAHAHCDALSFEWSVGGRRIVVDTGVDRYEAGPERDFQRGTAAHSTLQVEGLEQAECFGSFRMGRRPHVTGRRIDAVSVEGEHDGFGSTRRHRRRLTWLAGRGVTWIDRLEGGSDCRVAVRLGLAPCTAVDAIGVTARLEPPGGPRMAFEAPGGGSLTVEDGRYCTRFGSSASRPVLTWRGVAGRNRAFPFSLKLTD